MPKGPSRGAADEDPDEDPAVVALREIGGEAEEGDGDDRTAGAVSGDFDLVDRGEAGEELKLFLEKELRGERLLRSGISRVKGSPFRCWGESMKRYGLFVTRGKRRKRRKRYGFVTRRTRRKRGNGLVKKGTKRKRRGQRERRSEQLANQNNFSEREEKERREKERE